MKLRKGEEIKIELEWNFQSIAHAKDWSVVVHGDGKPGSLTLTHTLGYKSDELPH